MTLISFTFILIYSNYKNLIDLNFRQVVYGIVYLQYISDSQTDRYILHTNKTLKNTTGL